MNPLTLSLRDNHCQPFGTHPCSTILTFPLQVKECEDQRGEVLKYLAKVTYLDGAEPRFEVRPVGRWSS